MAGRSASKSTVVPQPVKAADGRACTVELRIVPLHKEGGGLLELAAGRLRTVTVEL
ncbi:hypothetical protein [Kitasatospora sp. DSM 101779]|uniref:hypothetical protein n=1 Tax=Kitasatospora sp. DSM 101779 TaxID=2853165 RepID=UPI0021D7F372|nr:hypothetical protein [Kitasatospora sp. DSM 101779]MCU7825514.1 hypothetical protein [Kitasatospora sp. DSM 101779]